MVSAAFSEPCFLCLLFWTKPKNLHSSAAAINFQRNNSPLFFFAEVSVLIVLHMQTALLLPFGLKSTQTHTNTQNAVHVLMPVLVLSPFVSIFMCCVLQEGLCGETVRSTLSLKFDLSGNVGAGKFRF